MMFIRSTFLIALSRSISFLSFFVCVISERKLRDLSISHLLFSFKYILHYVQKLSKMLQLLFLPGELSL